MSPRRPDCPHRHRTDPDRQSLRSAAVSGGRGDGLRALGRGGPRFLFRLACPEPSRRHAIERDFPLGALDDPSSGASLWHAFTVSNMANPLRAVMSLGLVLFLGACGSDDSSAHPVGMGGESRGLGGAPVGGAAQSAFGGRPTGGAGATTGGASSLGELSGGSGGSATAGSGGIVVGGSGGTVNGGSGASAAAGSGGIVMGGSGGTVSGGSGGSPAGGVSGSSVGGSSGASGSEGASGGSDLCPVTGTQACYYVSPSGSDDAEGSVAQPFRTITRARDVVQTINAAMTGDIRVYLRGGDYRITGTIEFGSEDSGTNGHGVYYQAYPGETPVLSGSTKVTGWTEYDGSIYGAHLDRSTKLRNLYVNDARAFMASKTVRAMGGYGTYSVTEGQASWAWASGSGSDGIKYSSDDLPTITDNQDDLEVINGTTWNENIVTVRAVETTSDNNRALLLQQPYGAIAQLPGWNAGFRVEGTHIIVNAYELLNRPGDFFFDKTTTTLYYIPRPGEDMATASVEAPFVERLVDISGTSRTDRVRNITFQGITFAHTDYNLYQVENSRGKATCQGSTIWTAYGTGDWHAFKYEIVDTPPAMVNVNSAEAISFVGNVFKHSGNEGIAMHNDVVDSNIVGNTISDSAGSGITIGHPQHIYLGDGGPHAKYSAEVEGICTGITIDNNVIYNVSTVPGFGGHSGIMAFFVDTLAMTHNYIHTTGYNGISLGWGWRNFQDSTTCKNNNVSHNRFDNIMARLHDSGAIYTIGQMPGTQINENYVRGIPPATSGPTYGLHNDEGSAYITENDNVLDISPGVTYTINCEDFGEKHDLTILRTFATVNKMGVDPPNSQIDSPVVVSDAVWPLMQYGVCLNSGPDAAHQSVIPSALVALQDSVFPASCEVPAGAGSVEIRSSGDATKSVWFAPAGTSSFVEGAEMTRAAGDDTAIAVPTTAGSYKLFVVDSNGRTVGESDAQLRVLGS